MLPFVGMVPGLLFGLFSIQGIHQPVLKFIAGLPATLLFVGAYAAIPYGICLLVVWTFFRPETEFEYRRIAIVAPIAIAAVFSGIVFVLESIGHTPSAADYSGTVKVWGGLALAFGYFYVVVIEIGLAFAKRLGWVRAGPPSGAPARA